MKLLIELPTWLGDCVMATPAIENIMSFYNDVEITLVGSFVSIELMKNHPNISQIVVLDKAYGSLYKATKNLGKFDVFFSFRSSLRAKFFKFFVSSKSKYQYDKNKHINNHQVKKYNNFVNDSLGIDSVPGVLKVYARNQTLGTHQKRILGISPGASYGSAKRWYPEKFAQVATELASQYDILIFGGPNEKDIADDIEKILVKYNIANCHNLAGNTTVSELIEHISGLSLFITGDSGPMHVAAAFQVPTVAIFGPTKDKETSQWMNTKNAIVKKDLECQPCMQRTCPLKHHNCMKLIEADDVLDSIKKLD